MDEPNALVVPKLNLMIRGDDEASRSFYAAMNYSLDDVIVHASQAFMSARP